MAFLVNSGLNFPTQSGQELRIEAGAIIDGIAPQVAEWLLASGHISPADAAAKADIVLNVVEEGDQVLHEVAAASPAQPATVEAPPIGETVDTAAGSEPASAGADAGSGAASAAAESPAASSKDVAGK